MEDVYEGFFNLLELVELLLSHINNMHKDEAQDAHPMHLNSVQDS
jgi:hypothetical protein